MYLTGPENFTILTDHKPLIPLINSRYIDRAPARCQRLLLRLMRFNAEAEYMPGKDQIIADTLSLHPLKNETTPDTIEEVKAYVDEMIGDFSITDPMLKRIQDETAKDESMYQAVQYTLDGWPRHRNSTYDTVTDLFHVRNELSVVNGLIVCATRVMIPPGMRKEIFQKIHHGHQGLVKCRERANQTVWWQRMSNDIDGIVNNCIHCQQHRTSQRREPLLSAPLPHAHGRR